MAKKWIFVAGAGIGYVLGTRAGREKYDRLAAQARQFLDQPKVKEATAVVQSEATRLYDEGKQVVRDKMRTLSKGNGHELQPGMLGSTEVPATNDQTSAPAAPTTTATTPTPTPSP